MSKKNKKALNPLFGYMKRLEDRKLFHVSVSLTKDEFNKICVEAEKKNCTRAAVVRDELQFVINN